MIAPHERCGVHDPVIRDAFPQMSRNDEMLRRNLTQEQLDAFQKYADNYDKYLLRMQELSFQQGFTLGCRLTAEALI